MEPLSTLHDLPVAERPRERLQSFGSSALSAIELLSLILGRGIRNEPVMVLSQKLLSRFGSLQSITEASLEDLRSIKGLGMAKACQLKACFEISKRMATEGEISAYEHIKKNTVTSPHLISELLRAKITNDKKENFIVISFDTRNKILSIDVVSVGILNASLIHPRELFEIAIRNHASTIIVGHNHPSGDLEPSEEDLRVTERLIAAGRIIGIEVLDHIIVSNAGYLSFRERNLFFKEPLRNR